MTSESVLWPDSGVIHKLYKHGRRLFHRHRPCLNLQLFSTPSPRSMQRPHCRRTMPRRERTNLAKRAACFKARPLPSYSARYFNEQDQEAFSALANKPSTALLSANHLCLWATTLCRVQVQPNGSCSRQGCTPLVITRLVDTCGSQSSISLGGNTPGFFGFGYQTSALLQPRF